MIPDLSQLTVFLVASLAMLVMPGPAVAYIVARSIDQGRSAGIVSALGLAFGSTLLILAAALGLSALLANSPRAYDIVLYAGAAYLAFLGIRTLMRGDDEAHGDASVRTPLRRIFAEGIVVNLLNPKTALFFFAFLPQFVDPGRNVTGQLIFLGITFSLLGIITDSAYAVLAGSLSGKLRAGTRAARIRRVAIGVLYLALAAAAILASKRQ